MTEEDNESTQALLREPRQRYRITVQYDGSPFSGWQRQDKQENTKTVQQVLERALSSFVRTLCKKKGEKISSENDLGSASSCDPSEHQLVQDDHHITVHTSSRTDAGVHAIMNTAHFDIRQSQTRQRQTPSSSTSPQFPSEDIVLKGLNTHLHKTHVSVTSVKKVASSYLSRFAAKKRIYVYKIILVPDDHINVTLPFLYRYAWFLNVPEFHKRNVRHRMRHNKSLRVLSTDVKNDQNHMKNELDIHRMKQVADFMSSRELDWKAMSKPGDVSRNGGKPIKTVRRIDSIDIVYQRATPQSAMNTSTNDPFSFFNPSYDSITITIAAQSFLYNQIRFMVHALVSVGCGLSSLEEIEELFRDPKHPLDTLGLAPPNGLFLASVIDDYSEQPSSNG